jgi:hypothetical protein
LTNLQGEQEVIPIRELLPRAFDAKYLKEVGGTVKPGSTGEDQHI